MFSAEPEDVDFRGGLGLAIEIQRRRAVGGLIAAGYSVEDRVGGEVHKLGAQMEGKLGEFLLDFRIERLCPLGFRQAGFDGRQGGAMDDGMGKLLEKQGLEGGVIAKIESPSLCDARNRRGPGAAEGQDLMPASQGGEADFTSEESGSTGDDEFHAARISLDGGSGKRGGRSLTLANLRNSRIDCLLHGFIFGPSQSPRAHPARL